MIRYALKCENDHGFESWFQSADAFSKLEKSQLVACPVCGSSDVSKSMMSPQVRPARSKSTVVPEKTANATETAPAPAPANALSKPQTEQEKALEGLRKHVEANSDYVGTSFVSEARAMHEGTSPERSIHGEARLDEAKALIEDGIPVAPLPFMPRNKTN